MRYFIGFMVTIGLFILLIFLLFRGGGEPKTPTTDRALVSYASSAAEVSMLIDGPINANSLHQQIRVTVDRENVTYEQMQGYDGNVTKLHSFPNTETSYANFLRSLGLIGFTKGNTDKALQDERGHCPLGSRYIFELREGLRTIQRFWATSCGNPKTYQGNVPVTLELFRAQVPDYGELSENVIL